MDITRLLIDGRIKQKIDTTANWKAIENDFVPLLGEIIIYQDYRLDSNNKNVPGMKIGNGVSFLKDLSFIDSAIESQIREYIQNNPAHVSDEEQKYWNHKIDCYIDPTDPEHLIFTRTKEAMPNA